MHINLATDVKKIIVQNGNGFYLTHTSSIKIAYCSVNTPFDEEEPVRRTDDRNVDDTSRILIHDEQDENHDVMRFKIHFVDNALIDV